MKETVMTTARLLMIHGTLVLCVAPVLAGQPEVPDDIVWIRQIGMDDYDGSDGVAVDLAGNVFVAGSIVGRTPAPNASASDSFLLKYDAQGNLLWDRYPSAQLHDYARSVAVDEMGNAYIARDGSWGLSHVLKYDTDGVLLWTSQISIQGSESTLSIAVDTAGNVYACGATATLVPTGTPDAFLAKIDSMGNLLWTTQIGSAWADLATSVALDTAGNALITGTTFWGNVGGPSAGKDDVFLMKFDAAGNLVWKRQTGSPSDDFGRAIVVDSRDNAYIAGYTRGSLVGNSAGRDDVFLVKYGPSGDLLWKRQFGALLEDRGASLAIDDNDNVSLAGITRGSLGRVNKGGWETFVVTYDPSGAISRVRQFGTLEHGDAPALEVDDKGNTYIAGSTFAGLNGPNAGYTDAYVMKIERGCYPDCDNFSAPGVLDIGDFLCFQTKFRLHEPYACNCDVSTGVGVCDIFDFLCFQNAFVAGCP
jgi:Beta-propeller repeat